MAAAAGEALVALLASLGAERAPPAVERVARQHVLEILAACFAGVNIPESAAVLSQIPTGTRSEIAVPATRIRCDAPSAAGALAALSRAAEIDPIHAPTAICAAAVTVPAALAVAQIASVDGGRLLAGVSGGYEMAIRLGEAIDSSRLLRRGWWPTAVCGGIAAAVSAAICLRLNESQLRDAIGLAAAHAGGLGLGGAAAPEARGLLCYNTVRTGVWAALAARAGVPGPWPIFFGSRNFLDAFAESASPGRLDDALGRRWTILETSLKRWPCALQAQTALDALSVLHARRGAMQDIEGIEVELPAAMKQIVDRPEPPRSRFAAAASVQFLLAAMLLDGQLREERFVEPARSDPRLLRYMALVNVRHESSFDERYPGEWLARVTIRDATNGVHVAESSRPPGHPTRPLSLEDSEQRFRRYASDKLAPARIEAVLAVVRSLGPQAPSGDLVPLLLP